MSVAPSRVANTEAWTDWESQVVNGVYPLRRFLGGSNHSAAFLTEYKAENLADAAIKFIPADTLETEAQLVQWGTVATLSHPHLVRLFDMGRCQFGGRGFLFVVMEYAEQTLAQILPRRALSPGEAGELLLPTLDALAFLHGNSLVHGQLKPSNFVVVNDRLKLASDTIRPTGSSTTRIVRSSMYDPPELKDGRISAASDVWDLGIALVEALTQRMPTWPDERSEMALLPTNLPVPFVDTVRRCLSRTPGNRPTVIELEAQYKPQPRAPEPLVPQPWVAEAPHETTPAQQPRGRSLSIPAIAAVLVLGVAVWVGLHHVQRQPDIEQSAAPLLAAPQSADEAAASPPVSPAAATTHATAAPRLDGPAPGAHGAAAPWHAGSAPTTHTAVALAGPARTIHPTAVAPPAAAAAMANQPSLPSGAAAAPSVVHEEIPTVPRNISERVHGHVRVTVRALVDPAGNVVGQFIETPGPSRYFARLAADAAGKWRFTPTDNRGSRVWLLQFDFTRGGAAVQAATAR